MLWKVWASKIEIMPECTIKDRNSGVPQGGPFS